MIPRIFLLRKLSQLHSFKFNINHGDPVIKIIILSFALIMDLIVKVGGMPVINHARQVISEHCVRVVIYMAQEMAICTLITVYTFVEIVRKLRIIP